MANPVAKATALHVLRLVLGRPLIRRFSAAVAHRDIGDVSTTETPSLFHFTAASEHVDVSEFLEPEDAEYSEAAAYLPTRSAQANPIPWPTIFKHGEAQPKQHMARPCDLVARLVAENRLQPARKVYDELKALHTPIQHRAIYLSAATQCLDRTPEGRAAFLFWLELYPNRPATKNTPELKATWNPVVLRLLHQHLDAADFIADFMVLVGRKGLVPTIMPLLVLPYTTVTTPDVSEQTIDRMVSAFLASTTSSSSTSERAERHRKVAQRVAAQTWNLYLRALTLAGWTDSARALLYSPPPNVSWSRFTRMVVLQQGLERKQAAVAAAEARAVRAQNDPMWAAIENKQHSAPQAHLGRAIQTVLDSDSLPSIKHLASLQTDLNSLFASRPKLLYAFRRRFTQNDRRRGVPGITTMWWWHAEIYRLARAGRHEEAVKRFREKFLWIGLPPLNVAQNGVDETETSRLVPTIRVISTVLPSILQLLKHDEAVVFHKTYLSMAKRLPPALQPNDVVHLAFVTGLGETGGASGARDAINRISSMGYALTAAPWSVLLLKLTGSGQFNAAIQLLDKMEAGKEGLPLPTARTYAGLLRLTSSHDKTEQTQEVIRRFKVYTDKCGVVEPEYQEEAEVEERISQHELALLERELEADVEAYRARG